MAYVLSDAQLIRLRNLTPGGSEYQSVDECLTWLELRRAAAQDRQVQLLAERNAYRGLLVEARRLAGVKANDLLLDAIRTRMQPRDTVAFVDYATEDKGSLIEIVHTLPTVDAAVTAMGEAIKQWATTTIEGIEASRTWGLSWRDVIAEHLALFEDETFCPGVQAAVEVTTAFEYKIDDSIVDPLDDADIACIHDLAAMFEVTTAKLPAFIAALSPADIQISLVYNDAVVLTPGPDFTWEQPGKPDALRFATAAGNRLFWFQDHPSTWEMLDFLLELHELHKEALHEQ